MTQKEDKLTWSIIALLLLVASILVLIGWFAVDMSILGPRRLATKAESWTEVPCSIRRIDVEVVFLRSAPQRGNASRKWSPAYAPRVEFDYAWHGKNYSSNRFWFGTSFWNAKSDAEAAIASYPRGSQAVCYVDPADPTQAVLTRNLFERHMVGEYWVSAVVLAGFVLVGVMVSSLFLLSRHAVDSTSAKTKEPVNDDNSRRPSSGYVLRVWTLSIVWNGGVSAIAYFTWVGAAPISFFILFLGVFWLVGLSMITVAIFSSAELVRRKLAS